MLGRLLNPLIGIENHWFLNHSAIKATNHKSSLPVRSRAERFKYIPSSTIFISNAQLAFTVSPSEALFASNLIDDSVLLLFTLCLLLETIFASKLVQSLSKLPAISNSCSKLSFSAKISCNAEWLAVSNASSKVML